MWAWIISAIAVIPLLWALRHLLSSRKTYTDQCTSPTHPRVLSMANSGGEITATSSTNNDTPGGLLILFGSQTGTAEAYAMMLAREAAKIGIPTRVLDAMDYSNSSCARLASERVVLFVMATYGEGEPTDSARPLHTWLLSEEPEALDFSKVGYSVFGLGDSQYKYFCQAAKEMDARMRQLGAVCLYPLACGDSDHNMEEDFEQWQAPMWSVVAKSFGLESHFDPMSATPSNVKLVWEPDAKEAPLPYPKMSTMMEPTQKQPAYARLMENRELLAPVRPVGEEPHRSTRHIVLDAKHTGVSYQAGDHVGLLPCNPNRVVKEYADALGLTEKELDTVIRLVPLTGIARSTFPCRVTARTALKWYVDLLGFPRRSSLRAFAHYCTNQEQKARFLALVGGSEYAAAQVRLRTVLGFLREFDSCRVPLHHFFELMPRIAPRYFSIASDSLDTPKVLTLVVSLVPGGLCSEWLAGLTATQPEAANNSIIPFFVRKSSFHLSMRFKKAPIVMIGPGTGIAPFIGFLQRRTVWQKKEQELGSALLFFGCRNRAVDFLYEEVLQEHLQRGTLTNLVVAFSRDTSHKEYVQHKLPEHAATICDVLQKDGYLYICGDAKHMAKDVEKTILDLLEKHGAMSRAQAINLLERLEKQDRYLKDVWSSS